MDYLPPPLPKVNQKQQLRYTNHVFCALPVKNMVPITSALAIPELCTRRAFFKAVGGYEGVLEICVLATNFFSVYGWKYLLMVGNIFNGRQYPCVMVGNIYHIMVGNIVYWSEISKTLKF